MRADKCLALAVLDVPPTETISFRGVVMTRPTVECQSRDPRHSGGHFAKVGDRTWVWAQYGSLARPLR